MKKMGRACFERMQAEQKELTGVFEVLKSTGCRLDFNNHSAA